MAKGSFAQNDRRDTVVAIVIWMKKNPKTFVLMVLKDTKGKKHISCSCCCRCFFLSLVYDKLFFYWWKDYHSNQFWCFMFISTSRFFSLVSPVAPASPHFPVCHTHTLCFCFSAFSMLLSSHIIYFNFIYWRLWFRWIL